MDKSRFDAGMELLRMLPSAPGIDPRERTRRYAEAFAGDDGRVFYAACQLGFNTVWRFFPTPVEIREQMERLRQAHDDKEKRAYYEALVERATEQNGYMIPAARAALLGQKRPDVRALPPPGSARRPLHIGRGGEPSRIGDVIEATVIDLASRRRLPSPTGGSAS